MARVPSTPSNGQPIDAQLLYEIVDSLIEINAEISQSATSQIQSYTSTPVTKNTNQLKIQAKVVNVLNAAGVKKETSSTGQVSFNSQFTGTPIVTATLVSRGTSVVKPTLTITGVDSSAVYYKIDYDTSGSVTIDISVIAIGV